MNKKVLSTMVGAVLAGGMSIATADAVIFGHIDTSAVYTDQDGGTDDSNFVCTTCSIGFKGSEDLGNGLKAIFFLDFQFDAFNRNSGSPASTNPLFDRDQWLGLAGSNWGQIRWGTMSTPYKSHGAMIDPLYRTSLQGRDRGVQSDFHRGAGQNLQGRADNTIRYDTPDWNGLKAAVFYTLDSNEKDGFGGKEDNNPFGAGVQYAGDNFLLFADWQDNDGNNKDVGGDITAWKTGGKYTAKAFGMKFGFYGQYEDASFNEASLANTSDIDFQLWHLAASVQLGNTMAYYAFGQGEYDDHITNKSNDYDTWTLAIIHSLSKRTKVYLGFSQVDCDARVYVAPVVAAPPLSATTGIASAACGNIDQGNLGKRGEDDRLALGMKHKF